MNKAEPEMSCDQKVRNISSTTKTKILEIQKILSEEWGFSVSLNGTLNHILSEGSNYLLTNKK